MDLLERYLQAIRSFLPRGAQDDILDELRENISSQVEEQEAQQNRTLTATELEEIIKRHGHPVAVAARYGRRQYLIGPTFFPFYLLSLKVALFFALAIRLIVAIVVTATSHDPAHAIIPALVAVPFVAVPVFGWITVIFALLDHFSAKLPLHSMTNWRPNSLPAVVKPSLMIRRSESITAVISLTASILWWQIAPAAPFLIFGPAAAFLAPAPVWTELHWPVLALAFASLVLSLVNVVQPHWTAVKVRLHLAMHAAGFFILVWALRAGTWIVLTPAARDVPSLANIGAVVNQVFFWGLFITVISSGLQLVWKIVNHFRDPLARPFVPRWQAIWPF